MTAGAWNRFVIPLAYVADAVGAPGAGDTLTFYETGTSTPLDTYANVGQTIANPNPVTADAQGNFGPIYLANEQYKVVRKRSDGTEVWTADPVSPYIPDVSPTTNTVVFEMTVDGVVAVPSTGVCFDCYFPFDWTISGWVLQAIGSGNLELDIWIAPFVANTPPTILNSIVASAPPTLSSSQSAINTTLTGWTKDIAAGSAGRFNINSIDTIQHFTLTLFGTKTS